MTWLVSVTMDGSPTLVEQKSRFIDLLKHHLQVRNLASFQCVLCQENHCD
jgi:hypothetical protein